MYCRHRGKEIWTCCRTYRGCFFDVDQYYLEQQFSKQQMKESKWFTVVASDGLYDVIPREEVIFTLGKSLFGRSSIECTCEVLIRKTGRLGIWNTAASLYRDDITWGVSKIWLKY
jgi:serine/threonine protein phosphatase PrpC